MTRFSLLLIIAGALTLLAGCSTTEPAVRSPDLPSGFPDHSVTDIRDFIKRPTDTLQRYAARARITVRSPENTRSFNARIRQHRADSLYMRISLFGMEGARMLLTSDSVFVYESREGVLRRGSIEEARRLFPAPVASGRVFENMLGLLAPNGSTRWTVEADSLRYDLSSPSRRRTLRVDPAQWRVTRYTRSDEAGTVTEKRLFSNFQRVDGVRVAHRVLFRRPQDNLSANIEYERLDLSPGPLSYDLDLPAGVRRTSLR